MSAVAPTALIETQLAVERTNLLHAARALESSNITADLRSRVQVRFQGRMRVLEERLLVLDRLIHDSADPAICWEELSAISVDATELLAECLAFLEGALVRSAGIDEGVCDVVDRLLHELSHFTDVPWARLSILGDDDHVFALADIVRVRFPEFSLWGVPIAGHEFGHVVSRHRVVIAQALAALGAQEAWWRELFSDLYATWTLGPAFACTTVLTRFRPLHGTASATHPPDAERVHVVMQTLERLHDRAGSPYGLALSTLRKVWGTARLSAELPAEVRDDLDYTLDQLLGKLRVEAPLAAYDGWNDAREFARLLTQPKDPPDSIAHGVAMRDVINAAWHCRLRDWSAGTLNLERLEARALRLARVAAANPPVLS
jgi:hypothetical protein